MGIRYSGIHDYGLFIPENLIDEITAAYNKTLPGDTPALNSEEMADEIGLTRYGDVCGEFIPFDRDIESTELVGDLFYLVSLDREKSMFKQVYKDMDEIIEEMTNKLKSYVSPNFDFKSRLGEIIGSAYD